MAVQNEPIVSYDEVLPLARPSADRAVDELDHALIDLLVADGRATYVALSKQVGLSAEAVRGRVERLIRDEIVRVVGSVSPSVLGYSTFALVAIQVRRSAIEVADMLAGFPETDLVVTTAGDFDVLAEVVCRSEDELLAVLERIRLIEGVRRCETFTYLELYKYSYGEGSLPAMGSAAGASNTSSLVALSAVDRVLIEALRHDGRASFIELAEVAGMTYPSARRRVLRLLDSGLVRVNTLVNHLVHTGRVQAGIGLQVDGDVREAARRLDAFEEIGMTITTIGSCDLMLEVTCASKADFAVFIGSKLRTVPGIRSSRTYSYLRIHKLAYAWSG